MPQEKPSVCQTHLCDLGGVVCRSLFHLRSGNEAWRRYSSTGSWSNPCSSEWQFTVGRLTRHNTESGSTNGPDCCSYFKIEYYCFDKQHNCNNIVDIKIMHDVELLCVFGFLSNCSKQNGGKWTKSSLNWKPCDSDLSCKMWGRSPSELVALSSINESPSSLWLPVVLVRDLREGIHSLEQRILNDLWQPMTFVKSIPNHLKPFLWVDMHSSYSSQMFSWLGTHLFSCSLQFRPPENLVSLSCHLHTLCMNWLGDELHLQWLHGWSCFPSWPLM